MATGPRVLYEFGPFRVDPANHELLRENQPIALTPKAFEALLILLRRSPEMVSKDEMMKELWPDTFVEEANLSQNIFLLRKALGDSPEGSRYIVTLPRLGYRFAASVRTTTRNGGDLVIASHTRSQIELEQTQSAPGDALPAAAAPHRKRIWNYAAAIAGSFVVAFALLVALNVAGLRERLMSFSGAPRGLPVPKIDSLAVLPLENVSRNPGEEYFAEGMTDEIIAELAKIRSLRIISRTSTQRFKSTNESLPEIARELNVDAILEGTVMHSGGRVRITAELVDATDRELWANSFESEESDVLLLQDEMARELADAIKLKLQPGERARLAGAGTIDPGAHDAYLKGLFYYYRQSTGDLPKAIGYLRQAMQLNPNYAEAYAFLAACYYDSSQSRLGDVPNAKAAQEAKDAALKALKLDPSVAEAHVVLGAVAEGQEWDWAAAESEFKRAIELDPSLITARVGYAYHLAYMGQTDAAVRAIGRAVEIDPASFYTLDGQCDILYHARHYNQAIEQARKDLEMFPHDPGLYSILRISYTMKRMYPEAVAAWQEQLKEEGEKPAVIAALGDAFRAGGIQGAWRWELDRLRQQQSRGPNDWYFLAEYYNFLGEREKALGCLKKIYAARGQDLPLAKISPVFDDLHSDPRFQALMARMNFPR